MLSCRMALKMLKDDIENGKDDPDSDFHDCAFVPNKILPDCDLVPQPLFDSGVAKIQAGEENTLTLMEKNAVASLLKNPADDEPGQEAPARPSISDRLREMTSGPKKSDSDYINANFILGSCAEVERLWSLAKFVLTDERSRMTPQLFEAILFLKVNKDWWGQFEVIEAMRMARAAQRETRLQKRIDEDANHMDLP